MKKLTNYLLFSIAILLSSCSDSADNNKKEQLNNESNDLVKEKKAEKVWNEFTIGAIGNTMAEMKFDLENITVNAGSWIRITLINKGIDVAMQHNIVFIKYGTRKDIAMQAIEAGPNMKYVPNNDNVIASSDLAKPGETVILEFKAPSKGNYEYLCTYPGHSEIMRGYFFVK
jgi:azurin